MLKLGTTQKKMTKALKKKWVQALRSGEYNQGTNYLKKEVGGRKFEFCCLGVLCAVAKVKLVKNPYDPEIRGIKCGDDVINKLSEKGIKLGLSTGKQSKLASMNDTGKSFTYIANRIEKDKTI